MKCWSSGDLSFGTTQMFEADYGIAKIFGDTSGVEPEYIPARMPEQLIDD